jgi:HK97 family phage major capsid protein
MASSIDQLNRSISLDSAANDFLKVAKVLAASRGEIHQLNQFAQQVPSARVREVLENRGMIGKAAVAVGTLSNSSAIAAYQQLAQGFFGSLSANSAYSRIYTQNDFFRVPLRTQISVLTTAPTAEGGVPELFAKPMSAASFGTVTLDVTKATSMIAVTNELARSTQPAAILQLGAELRRAASIAVDQKFLALMAATPGITTAASTGVTAAQVLADLTAAMLRLTLSESDSRLWAHMLTQVVEDDGAAAGYWWLSGCEQQDRTDRPRAFGCCVHSCNIDRFQGNSHGAGQGRHRHDHARNVANG